MDALFESIGRLLGVFRDPVNVLLLLGLAGLGYWNTRLTQFIMQRYDKDIESRASLATALNGLTKAIKRDDDD